jgi:hypothetical protein
MTKKTRKPAKPARGGKIAGYGIGRPARSTAHHDGDRSRRIGLRIRDPRCGRRGDRETGELQKLSAAKFHGAPPLTTPKLFQFPGL